MSLCCKPVVLTCEAVVVMRCLYSFANRYHVVDWDVHTMWPHPLRALLDNALLQLGAVPPPAPRKQILSS